VKLSQIAGVSAAAVGSRNPEQIEGTPNHVVIATKLSSPNPIVILSEGKDLCNLSC
jgi:hypothetical protein